MTFLVIRDTKEKDGKGWIFNKSKFCSGTQKHSLKTGDYTLEGFEDKLCVERKGCVSELAGNLMEDRFYRELDRMEFFDNAYLVLEFPLKDVIDYPYVDSIPYSVRRRIKITGAFLLRKLCEIQLKYKVRVIFCGDKLSAKEFVLSLFKRVAGE